MAEAVVARPEYEAEALFAPRRRIRIRTLPLRLKIGACGVILTLLAAVLLPVILRSDAYSMNPDAILQGPSGPFPLGTDLFGRDVLARVLYGMRTTYEIGIAVCLMTFVVGGGVGLL